MTEALIVSTARTGIGKAYRGALNNTKSPTMLGHAIRHAVQRAGVDPGEIDDAVVGTVLGAGTAGQNVGRYGVIAAGLPMTVPAQTIDRACSSGLMAIATAAKQVMVDGMTVVLAGGQPEHVQEQDQVVLVVGMVGDGERGGLRLVGAGGGDGDGLRADDGVAEVGEHQLPPAAVGLLRKRVSQESSW